ncbi:MAG: hypothetical protein RJB38_1534 [Pseudomonadota bacterium]
MRARSLSWHWILIAASTLVYLPFLNRRLLPTAGDEKVYVEQALEMTERGTHFVQFLFGEPNYFKGPLHLLLIQIGQALFGLQLIALRYMNLPLVILAGLAVGATVHRHCLGPQRTRYALWAGLACVFSAGSLGHVLATQMEIELFACYASALWLLDRSDKSPAAEFGFWAVAGIAGWAKSPLHSVLIGASLPLNAILRAGVQNDRQALLKLLRARSWLALGCGVLISVAGYLPAIIHDWPHFYESYIVRESLKKAGGNGGPHWQVWFPLFFYYLFPWQWTALALYAQGIRRLLQWRTLLPALRTEAAQPWLLIVATLAPTLVFFWFHPYRGENYTYPAQGSVILLLALIWNQNASSRMVRWSLWPTALQLLIPAVAFFWLTQGHSTDWIPHYGPELLLILAALSAIACVKRPLAPETPLPAAVSILLLLCWAGERELTGIRHYLARTSDTPARFCYWNPQKNIWNEAGYLSFTLGQRIQICHELDIATKHLESGGTLIVRNPEEWQALEGQLRNHTSFKVSAETWTRWARHGHLARREPSLWAEVRATGNWSALETSARLVTARKTLVTDRGFR